MRVQKLSFCFCVVNSRRRAPRIPCGVHAATSSCSHISTPLHTTRILEGKLHVDSVLHLHSYGHVNEWKTWDGLKRQSEEREGKVAVDQTDKADKGIVGGERTTWERHRSVRRVFRIWRHWEKRSWTRRSQAVRTSHVMLKSLDFIL